MAYILHLQNTFVMPLWLFHPNYVFFCLRKCHTCTLILMCNILCAFYLLSNPEGKNGRTQHAPIREIASNWSCLLDGSNISWVPLNRLEIRIEETYCQWEKKSAFALVTSTCNYLVQQITMQFDWELEPYVLTTNLNCLFNWEEIPTSSFFPPIYFGKRIGEA